MECRTAPMPVCPRRFATIFNGGRLLSGIRDDDPFLAPDIDPAYAHVALREAMVTLHADLPDRIDALIARGEGFRMMGYHGPRCPVGGRAGRTAIA
jgi:hypothetical protein